MIRARIDVSGVIQGVGFRPFIYRLANEQGLTGYVANTAAGVTIEVNGTDRQIDHFIETIANHKPPLATITDLTVAKNANPAKHTAGRFDIRESLSSGGKIAILL